MSSGDIQQIRELLEKHPLCKNTTTMGPWPKIDTKPEKKEQLENYARGLTTEVYEIEYKSEAEIFFIIIPGVSETIANIPKEIFTLDRIRNIKGFRHTHPKTTTPSSGDIQKWRQFQKYGGIDEHKPMTIIAPTDNPPVKEYSYSLDELRDFWIELQGKDKRTNLSGGFQVARMKAAEDSFNNPPAY